MYVDTKYGLGVVVKEFTDRSVLAFIGGYKYFLLVINPTIRKSISYNNYK